MSGRRCPLCGNYALMPGWETGDRWRCVRERGGCGARVRMPAVPVDPDPPAPAIACWIPGCDVRGDHLIHRTGG